MFGKRRKDHPAPAEIYEDLRQQIFELDPADVGIASTPDLPTVWGTMIDMGQPDGTATLLALADGTTSLYTSGGGGILGAGEHAHVAAATMSLLHVVERHLCLIPLTADRSLPVPGRVVIRALTYLGAHATEAAEADLAHRRHSLSPVFHAAHAVLTELRMLDRSGDP